jgi:hypothetical protein
MRRLILVVVLASAGALSVTAAAPAQGVGPAQLTGRLELLPAARLQPERPLRAAGAAGGDRVG